jgi:hypothetical protein
MMRGPSKPGSVLLFPIMICSLCCFGVIILAFLGTGAGLIGVWAETSNPSQTNPRFGIAIGLLGIGFLMTFCWACGYKSLFCHKEPPRTPPGENDKLQQVNTNLASIKTIQFEQPPTEVAKVDYVPYQSPDDTVKPVVFHYEKDELEL